MATVSYWITLFVCLFFVSNPINTSQEMKSELNQQTIQTATRIVQQIKTIQKHCKENNLDLETFLSKEKLKQYQESLAYMKEYLPYIKADALAMKQESKNTEDPTKDIGKPSFVEALVKWKQLISSIFKELATEYKEVLIDPSAFENALGASTLPIVNSLLEDWKSLVGVLPKDSTTALIVFNELLKSKTLQFFTVKNEKKLGKLYNQARAKYSKLENDIKKFQNDVLPNKALFIAAIEASTNSEDANLPDNKTTKADTEKEKIAAYQKVLNAWLDREIANLKHEGGDDTLYVDMSRINENVSSVVVHNFPETSKIELLREIRSEAKKLYPKNRRLSVKNLKVIAAKMITNFHTNNSSKQENYQDFTLEEIKAIKFPSNVAGWISDAMVGKQESEAKNAQFLAYEKVFEAWYKEEHQTLSDTNASEQIRIDPSLLDLKSGKLSDATIPNSMTKQLLDGIKQELLKEEKARDILTYNDAAAYANNILEAFKDDYSPSGKQFDYEALPVKEIAALKFPSGLASWIKEARIEGKGVKKDIKNKINAELKLVLKNTNNFQLEALIKELKIDMGGITINNDFNFDNDLHITYNSLKLILDKLLEINKPKPSKGEAVKTKNTSKKVIVKGFKVAYYKGCSYQLDLELPLDIKTDEKGGYALSFGTEMESLNDSGIVLTYYKNHLEQIKSVSIKQGEQISVKVGFSISYKYNQALNIVKKKDSGYSITEVGGNAGARVSLRFVELFAGVDMKHTVVSDSDGEEIHQGSPNITFTDYYTFDLSIKSTAEDLELGIKKDISFANSSYARVLPQYSESVQLCGDPELK